MAPHDQPSFWKSPMTWVIAFILIAGVGGIALAIATSGSNDGPPETAFAEIIGDPLPFFGDTDPDVAIGTPAPTVSAQTFDGERVTLEADGTPRLYGFFAHWCPVCQGELPEVVTWMEDSAVPDDVEVVAISTSVDSVRGNYPPSEWFETEGFTGTVLMDSESSDLAVGFGLPAFPYWVAVDGDGNVVARTSGALEQASFEALLATIS